MIHTVKAFTILFIIMQNLIMILIDVEKEIIKQLIKIKNIKFKATLCNHIVSQSNSLL